MNALWSFVISIVLGVVLGLLAVWFDEKDRAIAGVLGLVIVCLGGLITIYFEMRQLRLDQTETLRGAVPILRSDVWKAVVKDVADYDRQEPDTSFTAILEDPVRKNIETYLNQATNGTIDVEDKGDVVRITSELMDQARTSVEATSFVDPKDWWKSSIGDNYLIDMRKTKKHVPTFTRVFLLGSTDEARLLNPIFQAQRQIGVDVRYACAAAIPQSLRRDFIVIDGVVAADLALNQERHFERASFYSTRQVAGALDRQFRDLLYYATPYSSKTEVICPTLSDEESKRDRH